MTLALAAEGPLDGLIDRPPFDRVLWNAAEPGLRTGVLPPGVDEPALLGELVGTLRAAAAAAVLPPVVLALHEGLASLVDGGFRGPGMRAVRDLARHRGAGGCTVVISRRLFEDLADLPAPALPVTRFCPVEVAGTPAVSAQPLDWSAP